MKCCIFWSWCNLDNVGGLWNFGNIGNLWCCWMSLGLNFVGIQVVKNFGKVGDLWYLLDELFLEFWGALKLWRICFVGLVEQNHDECGRFVGMCNLWQNFVGMSMEKFCGYEIFFLWIWYFCNCTWTWSCGNFFQWHGYGKNLVVVYGHVKNFGCGKIWRGIDFFVVGHWLFFFLGSWEFFGHDFGHGKFFGHVILVMEIFWTHDSGHGKFFGHVILVMGNVLDIWFWSWEFFGHVETLNEISLEFTWWGLVVSI